METILMARSTYFLVDPFLMCLPNPCNSYTQIDDFVNALLAWSVLLSRSGQNILISDSTRIALLEDEEYPHSHRLLELLKRFNYQAADHLTISQLVQNLLDKTPSLEGFTGIDSVLVNAGNSKLEPQILLERLKGKTKESLFETIAILLAAKKAAPTFSEYTILLASSLSSHDSDTEFSDLEAECEIHDLSSTVVDHGTCFSLPEVLKGTIPFAWNYNVSLRKIGALSLWSGAISEDGATDSINLSIFDLESCGVDPAKKVNFRLGPHFLLSSRTWGFGSRSDYASLLIETCARIVLGIPKNPLNEFFDSVSGDQKIRGDGALAFRTHLTSKGAGFRCMIWRLPDGTVEFANVGDKNELVIR